MWHQMDLFNLQELEQQIYEYEPTNPEEVLHFLPIVGGNAPDGCLQTCY